MSLRSISDSDSVGSNLITDKISYCMRSIRKCGFQCTAYKRDPKHDWHHNDWSLDPTVHATAPLRLCLQSWTADSREVWLWCRARRAKRRRPMRRGVCMRDIESSKTDDPTLTRNKCEGRWWFPCTGISMWNAHWQWLNQRARTPTRCSVQSALHETSKRDDFQHACEWNEYYGKEYFGTF